MADQPQRYFRIEFSLHQSGKPTVVKLALKPTTPIRSALVQVKAIIDADTNRTTDLDLDELKVMDTEGFWLPHDSPINCVLKENDKVNVYHSLKRKFKPAPVSTRIMWFWHSKVFLIQFIFRNKL